MPWLWCQRHSHLSALIWVACWCVNRGLCLCSIFPKWEVLLYQTTDIHVLWWRLWGTSFSHWINYLIEACAGSALLLAQCRNEKTNGSSFSVLPQCWYRGVQLRLGLKESETVVSLICTGKRGATSVIAIVLLWDRSSVAKNELQRVVHF